MKQFCIRGHDTNVIGRNSQGACKACLQQKQRLYCDRKIKKIHEYKVERGCKICGYKKCARALVFHHRDPSIKEIQIGRTVNVAWSRLIKEFEKCDVLCMNCHMEIHDKDKNYGKNRRK